MALGPFCDVCVGGESLCASCQDKLDRGELCPLDLSVSRFVHSNRERYGLSQVQISKCLDDGHAAIIFCHSDPGLLIGKGGHIAKELAGTLNRRVKVVFLGAEMHTAAEELLNPASLLGINQIYSPSGITYKVRVPKAQAGKLSVHRDTVARALSHLSGGKRFAVVFE
jgi:transcription antitermination factor NusA-like protein